MAELRPYPFAALIRRMMRELEERDSVFDLPRRSFFNPVDGPDLGVRFHGRSAATPLGPAAGPQSQMAQNIALAWLSGGRIVELKTVQINDELTIPRPCIDMRNVGLNAEWSQELKLEQSLEEYVKGAMLVRILQSQPGLEGAAACGATLLDMSVGYDLDGIRSPRVLEFIHGMKDATAVVERLRAQIPAEYAELRDLEFPTELSQTLTLSTFHGCPPEEIESIIEYLLEHERLDCIVKLNPMLLGPKVARGILHDSLGYDQLAIPDRAFVNDTKWQQAVDFVGRLGDQAQRLELGFGVKFSNTLIVENTGEFLPPEEKEVYLSGAPLHVLAMSLVGKFRACFGDRYPVSFSAGIDRRNFADSVALGLVPVTVCSDLLRPGGYARGRGYLAELQERMAAVGAKTIDEWVVKSGGCVEEARSALEKATGDPRLAGAEVTLAEGGDPVDAVGPDLWSRWVSAARLLNTERYVGALLEDERYHADNNAKKPRKINSSLELFDCVTCDKCIPVCPNDANFRLEIPPTRVEVRRLRKEGDHWREQVAGEVTISMKHQIANFADFCNECGNCDVFCPEDGGPYVVKPRFFGSRRDWEEFRSLDGFQVQENSLGVLIRGRIDGKSYALEATEFGDRFSGDGFEVDCPESGALAIRCANPITEIDLTISGILGIVRDAVAVAGDLSYPGALLDSQSGDGPSSKGNQTDE